MTEEREHIAIISTNVEFIKKELLEIKDDIKGIRGDFVTKIEFQSLTEKTMYIRNITYSLLGLVIIESIGLVFALMKSFLIR